VKRLIIALVVGLVIFAMVYAFAATLNVNTKSLGAGGNAVASCNASANVSYNAVYSAALPGYKVSTVPITSAAGCARHDGRPFLRSHAAVLPPSCSVTGDTNRLC